MRTVPRLGLENIETLDCRAKTEIVAMDAMAYLRGRHEPFDIIFADPPYRFPETSSLPDAIIGRGFLASGGYLLIEHTTEIRFSETPLYGIVAEKRFGRTLITFVRQQTAE